MCLTSHSFVTMRLMPSDKHVGRHLPRSGNPLSGRIGGEEIKQNAAHCSHPGA
jgi:hypothetical protein